LDNNNVARCYRKEKKEIKQRKKRKIWGEGCFGERLKPKITTSFFYFLANGSAALLAGQPAAWVFMTQNFKMTRHRKRRIRTTIWCPPAFFIRYTARACGRIRT
jgi:hypothetical protein